MISRRLWVLPLVALSLCLGLSPAPAAASRPLLTEALLHTSANSPPPEGEVEGACGLAVDSGGNIYVSDYYHRTVDVFSSLGDYESQIALAGTNSIFGTNRLDAVCGLALDSGGLLYGNELHQGVLRLQPSEAAIDSDDSTGVAVDGAGDLYVDDRTRILEYEAPVAPGDPPVAEIGLGSLGDGYGLAVSASGERIYVADASDQSVKVYEPASDPEAPARTITGFTSLRDGALALDPTNGHLLVVDNTQPGFEHPRAVVEEYDGSGAFLGALPGAPIDGEPSGIAVNPGSGALYVTSGNEEEANVFSYGPYGSTAFQGGPATEVPGPLPGDATAAAAAPADPGRRAPRRSASASASEVLQRGRVRVKVNAALAPTALPRHGSAGVHVSLETKIAATDGGTPPQLRRITIAINRHGHFEPKGLPVCRPAQIQPASSESALEACRRSLVGEGRFSADVKLPEQSPFPSAGKVLAFNGFQHGHPVILAHVFGTEPVPTSFTLPFRIDSANGTYGTVLRAVVPAATGGFITGLRLNLGRSFGAAGRRHSYISAGCPAPTGFRRAVFPLARTSFSFAGGPKLLTVLHRSCRVR